MKKYHNTEIKFSILKSLLLSFLIVSSVNFLFAANITFSPSSASYSVGKVFTVNVLITGNEDSVNAVSSVITFSSDIIELSSISKSGSIITLWAEEPTFSNSTGRASFEGVILNPGFDGTQGKIVTLTFKAKRDGVAKVTVSSGSVLANDGNATNVARSLGQASFSISGGALDEEEIPVPVSSPTGIKPVIKSSTHPDSTKWYRSKEASFDWNLPQGVSAVRTLSDENPLSTPTKIYDPAIGNRSLIVDQDGSFYLHVQFRSGSSWGTASHFKFQIDTTPPESLKASFPDGIITTNPTPTVLVIAGDELSGVDYLNIKVNNDTEVKYSLDPSNLYRLPRQRSGDNVVNISAVDKAGNSSSVDLKYTIQALPIPVITEYSKTVELGKQLLISGTTNPQMVVEITLTDEDGNDVVETTTANESGTFKLIWSKDVDAGVYGLKARATDSKGAYSEYTDEKTIIIEHVALIKFGIFVMNWLSLLLIIIIAIVAVIATLWYSLLHFGRWRRGIHRNLLEVENALKLNVAALRSDIEEFHNTLIETQKKRALTKEEREILKKFKKRLEITEKEIEIKLDQVD